MGSPSSQTPSNVSVRSTSSSSLTSLSSSSAGIYLQSCDFCRRRKRKCDRLRPQCSNCAKQGVECLYSKSKLSQSPDSQSFSTRPAFRVDTALHRGPAGTDSNSGSSDRGHAGGATAEGTSRSDDGHPLISRTGSTVPRALTKSAVVEAGASKTGERDTLTAPVVAAGATAVMEGTAVSAHPYQVDVWSVDIPESSTAQKRKNTSRKPKNGMEETTGRLGEVQDRLERLMGKFDHVVRLVEQKEFAIRDFFTHLPPGYRYYPLYAMSTRLLIRQRDLTHSFEKTRWLNPAVIEDMVNNLFHYMNPLYIPLHPFVMECVQGKRPLDFLTFACFAAVCRTSKQAGVVSNPPYMSGSQYYQQALNMLPAAIEEASIPNLLGIMCVSMYENGLGRRNNSLFYSRVGARMAQQLGLHQLDKARALEKRAPKPDAMMDLKRRIWWLVHHQEASDALQQMEEPSIMADQCFTSAPVSDKVLLSWYAQQGYVPPRVMYDLCSLSSEGHHHDEYSPSAVSIQVVEFTLPIVRLNNRARGGVLTALSLYLETNRTMAKSYSSMPPLFHLSPETGKFDYDRQPLTLLNLALLNGLFQVPLTILNWDISLVRYDGEDARNLLSGDTKSDDCVAQLNGLAVPDYARHRCLYAALNLLRSNLILEKIDTVYSSSISIHFAMQTTLVFLRELALINFDYRSFLWLVIARLIRHMDDTGQQWVSGGQTAELARGIIATCLSKHGKLTELTTQANKHVFFVLPTVLVNRLLSEVKRSIAKLGPQFNLRNSPTSTPGGSAGTAPEGVSAPCNDPAQDTSSQRSSSGFSSSKQSEDNSPQPSGSGCELSTTSTEPKGMTALATVYARLEYISQAIPRRQAPLPKVSTQDMLRGQDVLNVLVNQILDGAKLLSRLPKTGNYEQSLRKSHQEQAKAFVAQFQPDPSLSEHEILEAINEYLD
ncbi:hypothetical protein IWQ62_000909 [Dispira parvispora]|uniref:Zn(2)-C6 fungal-type domain-containing protein n=1 Tax=Dispira parvispora TaxID=1520584 RepID=A0A9W8E5J3_9FUNG|nr:hypothetical protein IWQ62_000909 [Dispira parvispora]